MDHSLLHAINGFFARHDGIEDPLVAYATASEILFLGALVAAFVLTRGGARVLVRRVVVAAGLSAGLGLAIAQVITHLADRPRPFVSDPAGIHLFARHAADPGFPSDHTTAAFAIAVAITLRSRRWGVPVLALALVLGVARVGMGVHYPSDVLGGAVLGAVAALLLWAPPVRRLVDRVADRAGSVVDALVAGTRARLRPASRT